ncbi:Lrp/AsnC ligand binding domain-containing protein [Elstera cyanobacteriorum]
MKSKADDSSLNETKPPMLDDLDLKICRVLQQDGRLSNADLARAIHLSPAACFDRVKRLRREGYITGFAALLDPEKFDRGLLVFVQVLLDRTTPDAFSNFAAAVRNMPEVLECHMVAGGFDYLVKARVKDMAEYRRFLGDALVSLPSVRETHTYAVMEEVKAQVGFGI